MQVSTHFFRVLGEVNCGLSSKTCTYPNKRARNRGGLERSEANLIISGRPAAPGQRAWPLSPQLTITNFIFFIEEYIYIYNEKHLESA